MAKDRTPPKAGTGGSLIVPSGADRSDGIVPTRTPSAGVALGADPVVAANDTPSPDGDTSITGAAVPAQYGAALAEGASDLTQELGGTGLKGAEPYNGFLYEEFLPQLRGWQGARLFKEIADNDGMAGGVLFALENLLRNVTWRIDPKNQTPAAVEAAERVRGALFEDMAEPWGQFIDEALSMLTYGFSPHEIVWKRCRGETNDPATTSQYADGLFMPSRLPVRAQDTVWRWIFDTDGRGDVLGFEQFRIGNPNAVIPISKMLIMRTQSRRNNPEGKSILRNSYVPYMRKKTIEEAEGRLALRSAGVVVVRIPGEFMQAGAGADEKAIYNQYKAMATLLAQDRQGSAVLPSNADDKGNKQYSLEYVTADSRQVKDFTPIIDRHDAKIAISMLADFLLLGTKNVGSFALGKTKVSLFVLAASGFLGAIAEQVNRVLLRKVWRLNGLDPAIMPSAVPGDIEKADLEALGQYLYQIASAGAPIFPSPDGKLEQWLLKQAGAPNTLMEG